MATEKKTSAKADDAAEPEEKAPAKKASAKKAPATAASEKKATTRKAPAKKTAGKTAPAEEAAVEEPAAKPAAKKAPAKKTAAAKKPAAAEKAADEAPAEEAKPAKKPAAKKAPAKKKPAKAEPVAAEPAAEAPAAETPAAEEKPAAKKAPAKKKPAAKKPDVAEAPAEEVKPAKKPAAKKTTAKKATAKAAPEAAAPAPEEAAAPEKKAPVKKKAPAKRVLAKILKEDDGTVQIVADPSIEKTDYVAYALGSDQVLTALVNSLSDNSRRARQFSASILALVAREDPELLVPHAKALVDALHRPEAQTRWETLEALYLMLPGAFEEVKGAIDGAEASLYDEDSGPVRLAAFRFMCKLGAADAKTSIKVWPSIDEAIQCYHGDLEFQDMLGELVAFAQGGIAAEVKKELAARMRFDATNGKGALKRKSETILKACE